MISGYATRAANDPAFETTYKLYEPAHRCSRTEPLAIATNGNPASKLSQTPTAKGSCDPLYSEKKLDVGAFQAATAATIKKMLCTARDATIAP
ncbi:hypothetical protein F183_A36130 [Bryobacterales bacterium F-183]|nr:hypothetical protein F183_A36130 [Bryobacterales bacterium F-183]